MPQARGSQATFAIYEETTFATDPASPAGQKVYLTNFGLAKSQNRIEDETLTNTRAKAEAFLGNVDVSGSLQANVGAESIGTLLKHAIGAVATTGTGPYSHVFTVADLPVGLVIEVDYGANISGAGRYVKYNGCRVNSAEFNFPQEGAATVAFNVLGAKATPASAPLDAALDDNGHTTFSAFSASIQEGGSAIATVKSVSLTIDNGIDGDQYVIGGQGNRNALPEGFSGISGELTAIFDSTALMNKSLNDTESSLKIILSRGDGLGSAGNESIEFLVQQLKYEPTTPPIEGPAGVEIKLPFFSYKKGAALGLQVTLNNAVSVV